MPTTTAARTVLSYNVLEGFQQSRVQQDVFVEWVQKLDPDIIFYQELNHFTEASLHELAGRYGHPYAVRIDGPGYRPGLSSKYEISGVEKVAEGLRLGYIHAQILDWHVFALHLDPFREDDRLREIQQILKHAATLPHDAKILFAGDFNALSASDRAAYENAEFANAMKLTAKPDWTLRFDVTNAMCEAGYSDAYALFHDDFTRSWPTRKRIIDMADGCRIDYAFLSRTLQKECVSAEIVHDGITNYLSDHYPLVVRFRASEGSTH